MASEPTEERNPWASISSGMPTRTSTSPPTAIPRGILPEPTPYSPAVLAGIQRFIATMQQAQPAGHGQLANHQQSRIPWNAAAAVVSVLEPGAFDDGNMTNISDKHYFRCISHLMSHQYNPIPTPIENDFHDYSHYINSNIIGLLSNSIATARKGPMLSLTTPPMNVVLSGGNVDNSGLFYFLVFLTRIPKCDINHYQQKLKDCRISLVDLDVAANETQVGLVFRQVDEPNYGLVRVTKVLNSTRYSPAFIPEWTEKKISETMILVPKVRIETLKIPFANAEDENEDFSLSDILEITISVFSETFPDYLRYWFSQKAHIANPKISVRQLHGMTSPTINRCNDWRLAGVQCKLQLVKRVSQLRQQINSLYGACGNIVFNQLFLDLSPHSRAYFINQRVMPEAAPFMQEIILNSSQRSALHAILNCAMTPRGQPAATLIHGPPGTGKTTTLVNAIRVLRLVQQAENQSQKPAKTFVFGSSNGSVDNVILAYTRMCREYREPLPNMLRLGYGNSINDSLKSLYYIDCKVTQLLNAQSTVNMSHAEAVKRVLREAEVIFITLGSVPSSPLADHMETVIGPQLKADPGMREPVSFFDESSQMYEFEMLHVLRLEWLRKWILIGDPNQLGPTIICSDAFDRQFGQSLMKRAYDNDVPRIMLTEQARMDEDIASFPNVEFYDSKLTTASALKLRSELPIRSYLVFGVINGDAQCYPNDRSVSCFNDPEAHMILLSIGCMLKQLIPSMPALEVISTKVPDNIEHLSREIAEIASETMIISAYAGQQASLQSGLKAVWGGILSGMRSGTIVEIDGRIEVKTVDGVQGQEYNYCLLSTVRASTDADEEQTIGFLKSRERSCVALTRARRACYVFLEPSVFLAAHTDKAHLGHWVRLIKDAKVRKVYHEVVATNIVGCGTSFQQLRQIISKSISKSIMPTPDSELIPSSSGASSSTQATRNIYNWSRALPNATTSTKQPIPAKNQSIPFNPKPGYCANYTALPINGEKISNFLQKIERPSKCQCSSVATLYFPAGDLKDFMNLLQYIDNNGYHVTCVGTEAVFSSEAAADSPVVLVTANNSNYLTAANNCSKYNPGEIIAIHCNLTTD